MFQSTPWSQLTFHVLFNETEAEVLVLWSKPCSQTLKIVSTDARLVLDDIPRKVFKATYQKCVLESIQSNHLDTSHHFMARTFRIPKISAKDLRKPTAADAFPPVKWYEAR